MSDVGLGATLQLDIAEALSRIDQLQSQIDAATTGVQVTLDPPDASPVTQSIDEAVAAATTTVEPEADSAGVTSSIDEAVQAADGTVPIDADVSEAENALGGLAVDAQAEGVSIPVTADTDSAEAAVADIGAGVTVDIPVELDTGDAEQQASDLADTIGSLSSSASSATGDIESLSGGTSALSNIAQIGAGNLSGLSGLVGSLGGEAAVATGVVGGFAAVIGGLAESGTKAIESQQRFNNVFGQFADSITHVNVGSLSGDLSGLATSLGTSTGKLRDADTAIGNFGIASGRSQQEVARTAEQVDALALRVRALNPSLGDAGTIAEGLTGALARGGRAAGNYGISLTAADIKTRALALGLADSNGEIDQFGKLMAGASLTAERLGNTLGQDVANGTDNLTVRLDRLRLSFTSTAAEFGTPIAEPVVELLEKLAPIGTDVEHILGDVAQALVPVIGLLSELAVPVEVVTHAVADLNPDLIGLGAGAVAAAAGLGEIGVALTTELSAANPVLAGFLALIGLTVTAVSTFNLITGKNAQKQLAADVKAATSALEDENGVLQLTTASLSDYIDKTSRFSTRNQIDDLQRLGETSAQVTEQIERGARGFNEFARVAESSGEITRVFDDGLGHFTDSAGRAVTTVKNLKEINGQLFTGNTDLISSFQHEQQVLETTAAAGIRKALVDHAITDAQAKNALAADDQITAYNSLRAQIDIHAAQVVALTSKYQPFVDATLAAGGALNQLTMISPELGAEVKGLGDHTGTASLELVTFAEDASKAKLSADEMGIAAAALGTDADHLKGFIDGVSKALDEFASAAVGALPSVGDAFKKMGDDVAGTKIDESKVLSPKEFIANLNEETTGMTVFLADLKRLTDAGFGTLAGTIAEQGPAIGGSLADSLVTALDHGNTLLVQTAAKAVSDFNSEWTLNVNYLQTVLGPQFILQSGLVASLASSAFGDSLDFTQATTLATGLAGLALDAGGQAVVAIAFAQGTDAATQYGVGVAGMSPASVKAALDAGAALIAQGPGLRNSGKSAGTQLGSGFADGVVQGLQLGHGRIGQTVGQIANDMLLTGQGILKTGSPSKAARDRLGIPFGEGIIAGIELTAAGAADAVVVLLNNALIQAQKEVVAGAEALTAAAATTSTSPPAATPAPAAAISPSPGESSAVFGDDFFVPPPGSTWMWNGSQWVQTGSGGPGPASLTDPTTGQREFWNGSGWSDAVAQSISSAVTSAVTEAPVSSRAVAASAMPISVLINVNGSMSEDDARAAGTAAGEGIADTLDRRFGVDLMLAGTKGTVG